MSGERESDRARDAPDEGAELSPAHVRAVRLGHGANCSSVGSVIDTLFVSAAVGGAIFAAVCAAMKQEPVRIVGDAARGARDGSAEDAEASSDDAEDGA